MWNLKFSLAVTVVGLLYVSVSHSEDSVDEWQNDENEISSEFPVRQAMTQCEKETDCGDLNDVHCKYDSVEDKAICKCDNANKTYLPKRRQCAPPCQTDADCGGGRCRMKVGDKNFCACFQGFSGDNCEISLCETLCGNDDDVHCYFNNTNQPYCVCPEVRHGFDYDSKICKECDCGFWGKCELREGKKICHCEGPTYLKDVKCEDCRCGNSGTYKGCEFLDGVKKCICIDKYHKLNNSLCQSCYCGWNSDDCNFENGKQVCTCRKGYLQDQEDGVCKSCDCGSNGVCSLDKRGRQVCKCNEGYAESLGTCMPCKCSGPTRNDECKFDFLGRIQCECKEGYALKGSECTECDCGKNGRCEIDSFFKRKRCYCDRGYKVENGKCIAVE